MLDTPPSILKPQTRARADALIGAALQAPLRGRALSLMRLAWWTLAATTVGLFVLTIPARYSQWVIEGAENSIALQELGLAQNFFTVLIGILDTTVFIAYTVVGALIFLRKSHEWVGLLASLTLITSVFAIVRPLQSLLFVDPWQRIPLLLILGIATITISVFAYIFPDGHFEPRWTRWIVLGLCGFALYGLLDRLWLTQPFRWPPAPLSPVIYLGIFGGAVIQLYRYRRVSDSARREQMKWVVFSLAIGAVGLLGFLVIVPTLLPRVELPGMTRVLYFLIGAPLFFLALLQLPVALAVSIFRYHLWDIDLVISRALIFGSLTAILAGLFAALETIIQDLFVLVTGQKSDTATVIATLIVVAAFTPIKDAIQHFVENRFRDSTDPGGKLKSFAELVETRVTRLHPPQILRRLLAEVIQAYDAATGAAFLERAGTSNLIQAHGAWEGQAVICIPIQSEPSAARFGWLALGDRKSGEPYSPQDISVLEDLARKIGRALQEDALEDSD